ncbi:unnamed protein product [Symbiodinium sp. CCMP2592]|nr:unnamed protein product [Symbiodinium sp. CCMP2592]
MHSWQIFIAGIHGVIRLPQASNAARHRARLTLLVINVGVATVNYQIFADLKMYLAPIVPIAFVGICPASFLASYLRRHLPDKGFPHVLYDAQQSNMLMQILIFLVLTFYMFPLLLFDGDCQAIADSLVVGVLAYITAYFPLLERHTYLTCLVGIYAVVASMKTIFSDASFTKGVRHMLLQNCAYAILSRSLVYMLESRRVIPSSPVRSFSLARLRKTHLRRVWANKELFGQLLFLYHCRIDLEMDSRIVLRIVEFLRLQDDLVREDVHHLRLLFATSSEATCLGATGLAGSESSSQAKMSKPSMQAMRRRTPDYGGVA